jgi:hypothetical protein
MYIVLVCFNFGVLGAWIANAFISGVASYFLYKKILIVNYKE